MGIGFTAQVLRGLPCRSARYNGVAYGLEHRQKRPEARCAEAVVVGVARDEMRQTVREQVQGGVLCTGCRADRAGCPCSAAAASRGKSTMRQGRGRAARRHSVPGGPQRGTRPRCAMASSVRSSTEPGSPKSNSTSRYREPPSVMSSCCSMSVRMFEGSANTSAPEYSRSGMFSASAARAGRSAACGSPGRGNCGGSRAGCSAA